MSPRTADLTRQPAHLQLQALGRREISSRELLDVHLARIDASTLTPSANLTSHIGLPSLSVPAATSADGLPVGVQIIGAPYTDRALLAMANELMLLLLKGVFWTTDLMDGEGFPNRAW